jgi:tetratricopeptide (TPR) repeat protein
MDGLAALARARSLIDVRRYDEALDALAPAFGQGDTESEAWCVRAQALLGKGDLREALPAAREAVARNPQHDWPHRLLAIVLQRGGSHRAALRSAQEAARLSPDLVESLHVLAVCQANAGKRADAQKTAYSLIERHPQSALSHQTAATVATVRRDWSTAEFHLRESLRLEPNDAEVAAALGKVLQRQGRRAEAGEALLAAARVDPTDHTVRRSLGRLGLPVITFGGFGVVKGLVALQAARAVPLLHPATVVLVCAAGFGLVGGYLTYARISGTRALPEHVHRGLMADHRNYGLGWLGVAGLAAVPLSVWAAAAPVGHGQSWPLALGLAFFSVVALVTVVWLWTGPFPNLFPATTAWLERRRGSRRA